MPNLNYGAVANFLGERFGGLLSDRSSTPSIGITPGRAAERDPERVFLLLVNLSANDMFVAPIPAPSNVAGIRLEANGGSVTVNVREDAILPSLEWNATANGAGSTLYVLEVRRDTLTRTT